MTLLLAVLAVPAINAGDPFPRLAVIGPAEIVWNQTRDACPGKNWAGHVGEQPDSMPIAWHSPLRNLSFLVSSTDWGTYPTVGPSLSQLQRHDCSRKVYTAGNDTRPWTYNNHQWLQSVRVFPNGEMH